jgi:hypothetical protein
MPNTTSPTLGTENLSQPIPPLIIPKLRPSFAVIHYIDGQKPSVSLSKQIPNLEDALRIAWICAEHRSEGSTMVYAHARHPGIRGLKTRAHRDSSIIGSVPCEIEHRKRRSLREEIESAERSLRRWAEDFGRAEQRYLWFRRYGGFGSTRGMKLTEDEEFSTALFKNDFAAATARAAQLEMEVAA